MMMEHSCPKHVEKSNKHIKKICAPSWFYLQNIPVGVVLKCINAVFGHTQQAFRRMFSIWQPVSSLSGGHHQCTVQEPERIH
jgi:hypothetical protein